MSSAAGKPPFPSRTITVSLAAPAPCEHDWTAEAGYVYCHECGVGEGRPASTAAGAAVAGGR